MRRAARARELLDDPVPAGDLAVVLADVARLNEWFGGHAVSLARVREVASALPPGRTLVVVDVGGGVGDFARRVVRWARRARRPVRVLVLDRDSTVVALARRAAEGWPEIDVVQADAGALPLRATAADVSHASLILHHLDPEAAAAALAEMRRAARGTVVVNDLHRTRFALALVWLATRLLATHPISRHDGPMSVRRAYAPAELRALFERAGLRTVRVRCYPIVARLVAEAVA